MFQTLQCATGSIVVPYVLARACKHVARKGAPRRFPITVPLQRQYLYVCALFGVALHCRSEYYLQEVRYSIIELRDLLPLFATSVPLLYSHSHKCLETTLQGFSLRGASQGVAREASSSSELGSCVDVASPRTTLRACTPESRRFDRQ